MLPEPRHPSPPSPDPHALRIVIADDHRLVLGALERTLEDDAGFSVVGVTSNSAEVMDLVEGQHPDLVLLDIHMPRPDGLECLDRIRAEHPTIKVVLISAGADAQEIQNALRRGAAGYLVKSINPADIPAALRQVHEGTAYYAVAGESEDELPGAELARKKGLTPRELEMLVAVVGGASNREIAAEMWVTEQTVKFHLGNVYRKLDVVNRAAARSARSRSSRSCRAQAGS
jgi:DNA-binding NarL/FixJ family response regulator